MGLTSWRQVRAILWPPTARGWSVPSAKRDGWTNGTGLYGAVPNGGGFDNHWFASGGRVISAHVLKRFVNHRLRPFLVAPKFEDLIVLKKLIEAGKATPVIDRTYPLGEASRALGHAEAGHTQGKVVISV